ncbi:MAG: nucleoside-diphosphate sugar epimerase [Candidatus Tectimicrobiota bacterium]|nr:MAG: nucleoside-diphosphate sugar epimerase [Candidatus Tectomicrobia bacterium]
MRVAIAGATGVLGRRLVQQFRARGDHVVGLVRSASGEALVATLGGESRHVDLFDAEALARAAAGCEVLIHAATAIPVKARPRARDWVMNDRLRRDATRALAACAARIGARLYVQQSVIWVARPRDGTFFDEDTPPHPSPPSRSAYDGEEIAREAGEQYGFNVAVLRCGWFYGADAAHTRWFATQLRSRRLPIIGQGEALLALLHLDDAASAFVAASAAGQSGIWHVVDDQAVPVRDFLQDFAARLAAPPPRRVPVWLARLVAGAYAIDFFTVSSHTSNARFRRACAWAPQFPTFKEGLAQVVASWKATGLAS